MIAGFKPQKKTTEDIAQLVLLPLSTRQEFVEHRVFDTAKKPCNPMSFTTLKYI